MNAAILRHALEDWTRANSGWGMRPYLGMSQLDRCPALVYDQMTGNGHETGVLQAMAFYDSQVHKRDLIARLNAVGMYAPIEEIVAPWDDRFRGHPDGQVVTQSSRAVLQIHTMVGDKFEELREHGYPRQAHYYQVQLYMLYGGLGEACILYKCRETGRVWPIAVVAQRSVQEDLEGRARRLLAAVDANRKPTCVCGRCNR